MTPTEQFIQTRDFLLANREDYEAAYKGFQWPQLGHFNFALDYFDMIARGNDRPALWVVNEDGSESRLSFAEMSERSNRVANHLRGLGVVRGDRILMMLSNVVPLWEVMLAAIKLGAVVIPATTLLTHDDLVDRLERGNVRHVVVGAQDTEKFAELAGDYSRIVVGGTAAGWHTFEDAYGADASFTPDGPTRADDPLLLYFTSGTTSKPKLVEHTHQSYPVGHLSTMYWIGLRPGDIHLNISSAGWAKHAWSCFFAPWIAEATIFIYNFSRFHAPAMLDVLGRCGVTTLCAPPTVWRMLIQEDLKAHPVKLREVIGAGEPLNPEIIDQVKRGWGLDLRDGYGQTETTAQIGNSPGQRLKPGSMGRPMPGYQVVLLDPDGKPADEGEISLVLDPRPVGLMVGYKDDPGMTARVMEGGFYRTGDVAMRDADGYLTYVGRSDDVFKASDYRISPFELESVLLEHEAVAEAAVVPSPDPVRLAVPKAVVALIGGREPSRELAEDIFRFTREHLAPFKRIRRLEFGDLPKTISGKIRRVELRKHEAEMRGLGQRGAHEYWEDDFPGLKAS
ncbi:MAG: AMP-dependent synthetase [Rhodospirillales bacterium]|nr:MAG: AMP-dependent synthetase [Rhodospirillales bacterium]